MIVELAHNDPKVRVEIFWSYDGQDFLGVIRTLRNGEDRVLTAYDAWRDPRGFLRFPTRDDAIEYILGEKQVCDRREYRMNYQRS